ncbi:hypothetical protein B0T25DRAFT_140890 [Lasiosphaeria hispida]|uniref:Uncharacterized protein n=1 Tax=Lasiosphaeria hispida TaxID=260671 RepID=A0AAJ0MFL4_9PEZI|nr:hypothetical protein B0T25DRAFT_140890 [Lasiosphaeria hispida]
MASLNSLYEWRILQSIGSGVLGRLTRYKAANNAPTAINFAVENDLEFLETELRQIFIYQQTFIHSGPSFHQLQAQLTKLCALLERAVNLSLIGSCWKNEDPNLKIYANLQALLHYLNDSFNSVQTQTSDLDLVHGPNPTIFKIVGVSEVREALHAAGECNELLVQGPLGGVPTSQFTLPSSHQRGLPSAACFVLSKPSQSFCRYSGTRSRLLFKMYSMCGYFSNTFPVLPAPKSKR